MELNIEQTLQQGILAHREGRLQNAERLYRSILKSQPLHPDANHNLGVLTLSVNKGLEALPLFKTALEAKPEIEQFWHSYINALIKTGQLNDANQVLEQAKKRGFNGKKLNSLKVHEVSLPGAKSSENASPSQQLLNNLLKYYKAGKYGDAEKLALSITQEFPKHQFSWKILGAVLSQLGRHSEALHASQNAIVLFSKDPNSHYNLAVNLQSLGRLDEAISSYKQAIELKPDYTNAYYNLGIAFKFLGRLEEAEATYLKVIELKPEYAEAHYNLSNVIRELGRLEEAEATCRQAIKLSPDYTKAYNNLGVILHGLGKLKEAEASYRQLIELKPNSAEAHYNLGSVLQKLRRFEEAILSYRYAIKIKSKYTEAHNNLGVSLQRLGRLAEAQVSYRHAISIDPKYAEAYSNLGNTFKEQNRLNEAIKSYEKAINLKPNLAEVHRHLASMKKFHTYDKQFLKMQQISLATNSSDEQRCHINFGLAKAFEDLGDFKQAFSHYSEGNLLHKKLSKYDIISDIKLFDQLKSSYPQIKRNSLEIDNLGMKPRPIFIVGMPRSGTTLVEQIISSHPQVTGAGELPFVKQYGALIAGGSSTISKDSLLKFREEYLTKLQTVSNRNLIVTDKMPQNFLYIGLLASTFPEAKIIHVKRKPAAVCWSNYKTFFLSENLHFCYDIDDIVGYYKLYENLMDFWGKSLSKRIYNLNYELLTVHQENEIHQLIDYLGIDWDEKCLSPQDNGRSVETASSLQVRKKIYQDSSYQWKRYEPFLNGAFDTILTP